MFAIDIITVDIAPLKTSDTGEDALSIMEELKVSHLPIVNNVQFLGLISESDIYEYAKPEEPLGNHKLSESRGFITESQHLFDAVKMIGAFELTLLPVVDEKNRYLGSILVNNLVYRMANMDLFVNPGGIIVLEIDENNYSLSEIVQIVESNDTKILGVYLTSIQDSTKIEVTLKTNKMDISSVLQTFNRYNYIVKATFSEESEYFEDFKNRYESFLNYLNI